MEHTVAKEDGSSCLALPERSNAPWTSGDALGRRLENGSAVDKVFVDVLQDQAYAKLLH